MQHGLPLDEFHCYRQSQYEDIFAVTYADENGRTAGIAGAMFDFPLPHVQDWSFHRLQSWKVQITSLADM